MSDARLTNPKRISLGKEMILVVGLLFVRMYCAVKIISIDMVMKPKSLALRKKSKIK